MSSSRSRRSRAHEEQAPGWVWMLFGLALGLAVAVGVYLTGARTPADLDEPPSLAGPGTTVERRTQQARAAQPPQDPAARFDFYEILPQFEVVIPEVERGARADREPASVSAPGSYVLQAGSFRSHTDADRMQASLALLGVESRIQRVTIDDDVFHRVRVGPFTELDQLNRIRRQLHDAQIEVLIMRVPN
jgi:cell division protein FtsN